MRDGNKDYTTKHFFEIYDSVDSLVEDTLTHGKRISQGYFDMCGREYILLAEKLGFEKEFLPTEARLRQKENQFYFTLKGKGDISRNEFEREIDSSLFSEFWYRTKGRRVSKARLDKPCKKYLVEFDVYFGRVLVVAEVEFNSEEEFELYLILGKDVSKYEDYKNKNLTR